MSYTEEFFEGISDASARSAAVIVPKYVDLVEPTSVVDVGCGKGWFLAEFIKQGVTDVLGLDGGPPEHLVIPEEQYRQVDLTAQFAEGRTFDLAVCLEVAEHLPETAAEQFVEQLCALAPVVLFSAAIPMQGGEGHCFPPGTVVSGPRARGSFARRYEGPLVELVFASGKLLAATPNHPVLTPNGWVPAGALYEGCNVIRCVDTHGIALGVPDDHQSPALIEQVAAAVGVPGCMVTRSVPVAAEDFHGDGLGSQVAVVRSDRLLADRRDPSVEQPRRHLLFGGTCAPSGDLSGSGSPTQRLPRIPLTRSTRHQSVNNPLASLRRAMNGRKLVRLGGSPKGQSRREQSLTDEMWARPEAVRKLLRALPGRVPSHHLRDVKRVCQQARIGLTDSQVDGFRDRAYMHSGVEKNRTDRFPADAEPLRQRLRTLAPFIASDQVVAVNVTQYTGQVFNLQTDEGWYTADGVIVHNCNERWPDYWQALFARNSFRASGWPRVDIWDDKHVAPYYRQNLLLFASQELDNYKVRYFIDTTPPFSLYRLVHPEIFGQKLGVSFL